MNSNPTLNSFMPISKLGEGTFSSVYKVKRISDGGVYALKKIKIACLKQKQKANALNQIRILASLTSAYIITYKQAFFDEKLNLLCIVMQWANEGDLLKRINEHKQKKKLFSEVEIWKAAYHILSGLRVLHSNSILHRDMKSANIFICDGVYKLGDLNVSKVNDHQQRLVKTQTGTPFYASPQIWRDQPYGSQSDIWSFGCILYEMCCLKPPFNGKDLNDLYKSVQRGDYEPIPKVYSRQLEQVITMCLKQRAKDRPSADELLRDEGIILSKCDYYQIAVEKENKSKSKDKLLSTIKMPTDLKKLNSQLPQSKYQHGQEIEQTKTAVRISQSQNIVKMMKSNKIKTESPKPTNQAQQIQSCNKQQQPESPLPLPQRIKNHLNNINRSDKLISRKNYNQKPKIQSSITQPRQQITLKKSVEYLSPIKQNVGKKKRPFSCNYLQMRQPQRNPPYYISNLRPQSGVPAPIYNSDRKAMIGGLREKNEMFSDRKILLGQNGRDPYLLQKLQKIERDKIRCRSANFKSKVSGYSELKERLEARYKNIKDLPIYESQKITSKLMKSEASQHINYSKDLSSNYSNNFSYGIPTSLSAHIYPKNNNSSNNYLLEMQNKLLNNENKNNRYDLLGRNKIGSNQSQIRRLVKGHHLYGKIQKI